VTLTPGSAPSEDDELEERAEALVPLILAQIQNHLHLPLQIPDPYRITEFQEADPELYKTWCRMLEKQHDHDMYMERAPFDVPARIARRGQWFGLSAVMAVLILAAYMAAIGATGWGAGVAAVDIVTLAAVFARPREDGARRNR
jgi:hypothetical protein